MAKEIADFDNLITRTKSLLEEIQDKITNELTILKRLREKVQVGYEYIKPESTDLKGKRKVLMKLRNSKKKAGALSALEEIQKLLDNFNLVRRDLKTAMKFVQQYQLVFEGNVKEFDNCQNLYMAYGSESEDEQPVKLKIIKITSQSLPTFDWEILNWNSTGQDLLDRYNALCLTHRFDLLMAKFDKFLGKLI